MKVFRAAAALHLIFALATAASAEGPAPAVAGEPETAAAERADPALINKAPREVAGPPAPDAAPAAVAPTPAATAAQSNEAPAVAAPAVPNGGSEMAETVPPPEPTLLVDIDLSNQRMTVSENGVTKHTWAISSAAAGYRTPTGTYSPAWMSRMWYSRQYDWSPMPHAIFFHRGVAIHATQAVGMLGRPASHGCVRLAPRNAATLYKMVGAHGKSLTRIVVHGTPRHGKAMARAAGSGRNAKRRPYWSNYSYYTPPPAYYPAPRVKKRTASRPYYYPPPRRYVSRGLFQPGY